MSLYELPQLARNLICSAALFIIIGYIINIIQAISQRRRLYVISSVIGLIIPYVMFHVCAEISNNYLGGDINKAAKFLAELPWIMYVLLCVIIAVLCAMNYYSGYKYSRSHITPSAIKEACDNLPTGICYYNSNGLVFLANHKMNELSQKMTGKTIDDGFLFEKLIRDEYIEIDGTIYQFQVRSHNLDGEDYYEILAYDVTEIYRKNEIFKQENEHLKSYNIKMKEYGERIGEVIKREEILNAKTSIHDNMNKILLSTEKAIHSDIEIEKRNVLEMWMKNIVLLSMEASVDDKDDPLSDVYELGRLIGITVHFNREPKIENKKALRLFIAIIEEAMANSVKHAEAKNLYVEICSEEVLGDIWGEKQGKQEIQDKNEKAIIFRLFDDGKNPMTDAKERGGLKTIHEKLEKIGGFMEVVSSPGFMLLIRIPLGDEDYV